MEEVKLLLNGPLNIKACSRAANLQKGCSMQRALQEGCSGSRGQYRQDAISRKMACLLAASARNPAAKQVFSEAGDAAQAAHRLQASGGGGWRCVDLHL
jgi:hypothetical protein